MSVADCRGGAGCRGPAHARRALLSRDAQRCSHASGLPCRGELPFVEAPAARRHGCARWLRLCDPFAVRSIRTRAATPKPALVEAGGGRGSARILMPDQKIRGAAGRRRPSSGSAGVCSSDKPVARLLALVSPLAPVRHVLAAHSWQCGRQALSSGVPSRPLFPVEACCSVRGRCPRCLPCASRSGGAGAPHRGV